MDVFVRVLFYHHGSMHDVFLLLMKSLSWFTLLVIHYLTNTLAPREDCIPYCNVVYSLSFGSLHPAHEAEILHLQRGEMLHHFGIILDFGNRSAVDSEYCQSIALISVEPV